MNALLLVAHGSRRKESNDEVMVLAEQLKNGNLSEYASVHGAFLELAEPLIPDGIKRCVDGGATSVVVLPYFLNSGRHVVEDIPRIVADSAQQYPHVDIRIAPHIGESALMQDLLIRSANSALD
ncbi:CbiX/SirB N-terminal domain-containing protein [bacterium SCSIO 12696]|nr:CbiX/SirB N-terminal domain-containing protein [bacterium SCSIO 12696]